MKPFFIIVFLVHLLVNAYIFTRGWQALPPSLSWKIIYILSYAIIFSSFIIAMIGRNTMPLGLLKVLYFVGSLWLVCMLYFTLFFLLTDVVHLFNHFFHFLPAKITNSPKLFHEIQTLAGVVLMIGLAIYGYTKFTHPSVETYHLRIHKQAKARKTLRIAAFSDVHLGMIVDKERLAGYVKMINDQHPDIVLIAGDIIDNSLRPLNEEKMYEELSRIQAPLGVYTCLGNHEYLSGIGDSLDFFRKANIHVLKDNAALIDSSFWVIGRDDRSNTNRKNLSELVAVTDASKPLLLLDHQPYRLEEAEANGVDLQISGHTHNGQVWPFNLLVKRLYEVGHGYKPKGNTNVYVSSGLALWGPPFRIGTQSELIVFNLQFDE